MTNSEMARTIERLYARAAPQGRPVEVLDVFTEETHQVTAERLIEVNAPPEPAAQAREEAAAAPDGPPLGAVVVSVPHAGVLIPTRFADRFPRDEGHLVEIDLFSHLLYEHVPAVRVICRLAPTFIDMNRSRVAADEPHVPVHLRNPAHEYYTVADELILGHPYTPEETEEVLGWYDLYHGLLDALLRDARRRFGWALLIDGHSMTSVGLGRVHDEGLGRDSFVVGTLHGASAHDEIIAAFVSSLQAEAATAGLGLTVAENDPYSGGAITRTHHDPEADVHALQIEVTMDSYMYESEEPSERRRYTLKQHRLGVVRGMLSRAVEAAAAAGAASHGDARRARPAG